MQYDVYRDKVKKVAAFLSKMYAHMTLIILSLVALALIATAMVVTKGLMLTQSDCPETVTYGEELDYRASFLLSRTLYEYQGEGESRWTDEAPVTPGAYRVRASGKTSFGKRNYTDSHSFIITPREITVTVADSSVTYGDTPRATANLAQGDSLRCEILFDRYAPTAEVWVDFDSIVITDREGNDRTDCYVVLDTPRSSIRLTPRPLTVTVQDASKVYDNIIFTFDGYEITKGTLFGGDNLTAVFHDSIRDAGSTTNTPSLRIYSPEGEDMTELYALTVQSGTLTVEQRPLIVKTGSASYTYSGRDVDHREYQVDPSTPPVSGHYLEVKSAATLLDCGSTANTMTFTVREKNGRDVSHNYAMFVEAGTLTVEPRQVILNTESATLVYDGTDQSYPYAKVENGVGDEYRVMHASSLRDVGTVENRMTVEFYRGSKNITDNYRVVGYNFGTLTVTPRPLYARMNDAEKIYDGTPLTSSDFTVLAAYPLVEGHTMTLEGEGQVVFGTKQNPYRKGSACIRDKDGFDVTANYEVIVSEGNLTVNPRPITVTTASDAKIYDGTPLRLDGWEITDGSLLDGHELRLFFPKHMFIDAGSYDNYPNTSNTRVLDTATGEDVTRYYDISYDAGTLTVNPRPITVKTGSQTAVYSGWEMACRDFEVDPSAAPLSGHYLELISTATLLDCGSIPNHMTFVVRGDGGSDVSHNYEIRIDAGTLTVTPREITVITESASLIYDGTDQSYPYATVQNGVGDEYRGVNAATQRDVGQTENRMTLEFYRGNKNITANYSIVGYTYGTLTVTPRPLQVHLKDARKFYDTTPLTSSEYTVVGYPLATGHTMTLEAEGSVVFGTAGNPYKKDSARIRDREGNDVTANYEIMVVAGTLTVDPRPITISTANVSKIYDGTPLRNDAWEVTEGSVLGGHELRVSVPEHTITDVGSVVNAVDPTKTRVLNISTREDVTRYYNITYNEGNLTVMPRPIKVETLPSEWMYDGQDHVGPTDLFLLDGTLLAGHTMTPSDPVVVNNAGKVPNQVGVLILNGDVDVTRNYDVQYQCGTLTVHKRPITVQVGSLVVTYDGKPHASVNLALDPTSPYLLASGQILRVKDEDVRVFTDAGTYVNDPTVSVYDTAKGIYVTQNYAITRQEGTVVVEPRPLTIRIKGEKIYDGLPMDSWLVEAVNRTSLAEGHTVTAAPTEVPTNACTIESVLDASTLRILDAQGNDVKKNYTVKWQRGTLTVLPRPVSVQTASAEKIYDGLPLTAYTVTLTPDSLPLVEGDIVSMVVYGSATEVGYHPNSAYAYTFTVSRDGLDVTPNYELVKVVEGTLTVKYDTVLTVATGSASKDYDGMPLFCDDYTVEITEGTLPDGCIVYVDVTGSIIRPGTVENTVTVTVWDRNGNDVTEFMTVILHLGELTVREKTEDDEQVFGRVMTDTDGTLYLRMNSYGNYNGQGFDAAMPYTGTLPGGYSLNYLPSAALGYLKLSAQHTAYFADMQTFMLPYYMEIGGSAPVVGSDTHYTASVGAAYTATYYNTANTFDLLEAFHGLPAVLKPYLLGVYSSAETQYRSFVYGQYLSIDSETLNYMNQIIAAQGFDASDATVIKDVASYIQNAAAYNLYYDIALDESPNVAVAFLRDYREGICVHYATAATMLYRALGIPARYVTGFMIEGKAGEWVDVTNPGHAWVEVYIDYLGWVQVEVTGSLDGPGSGENPGSGEGPGGDIPGINKPVLEIIPAFRSKVYDGTYLNSVNELVLTPDLEALLNIGYTYTVRTTGSVREIGDGESHVTEFALYDPSGTEVTQNYQIVRKKGLLRITPPAVEVFLYPLVKTIDGRPAVWSEGDYTVLTLPDGVTLTLTVHIPAYDLGYVSLAELNLRINDYVTYRLTQGGQDVTDQYPLVFTLPAGMADAPVLEVRARAIEVTAASETRIYEGAPLTNDSVYISKGSLITGHTLVAAAEGACTSVGSATNQVGEVVILDQNGKDVTAFYTVTTCNGVLTLLDPPEE